MRLAAEDGISLIVVLGVMMITSALVAATLSLARSEVNLTSSDTAAKQAYYAALAGINAYAHDLTIEPNYLNFCTEPPTGGQGLNQYYKPNTTTPMSGEELYAKSVEVPGSAGERYAIQLVPAQSAPAGEKFCQKETNVVESMIEEDEGPAAGSFRIIATGFAPAVGRAHPASSAVVASFRNVGFSSFVYYTEYEAAPPALLEGSSSAEKEECRALYQNRPSFCTIVSFISQDDVKGPMHTNDHVAICGSPTFGRNSRDRIEFRDSINGDQAYSTEGQCSGTSNPNFVGDRIPPAEVPEIKPPPDDQELELIAKEEEERGELALFTGHTKIKLEGLYMTVEDEGTIHSHVPIPNGGVVYVAQASCGYQYAPAHETYPSDAGCGNAYVEGNYEKSLTIAAQNDLIITNSITTPHSGSVATDKALLGLVANDFVRIYHPATFGGWGGSCSGASGDVSNIEVWAAILAVTESFMVDNYECGSPEGTLTVHGAIAQIFRGPVGTFYATEPPTIASGYKKEYEFDERLRAAEPPHFLNPVEAAWQIQRETLAPNAPW